MCHLLYSHPTAVAMPSPCIVKLSKALYSDAPSVREPPSCSSSRKRGHAYSPAFERGTTTVRRPSTVRLLLPRSFAVADRELCAAADEVRGRKAGGISSTTTVVTGVASHQTGAEATSRADAIRIGAVGVDGVSRCQAECCCCSSTTASQEEDQRHPGRQTKTTVVAAGGAGAGAAVMMIVVESFLGFTAVRALLEQSYQHNSDDLATSSQQPVGECSSGAAVLQDDSSSSSCTTTRDRDDIRGEGEERFDALAAAETVRRLLGWLRLAGETAELEDGTELEMDESRKNKSPGFGTRRLLDEISTNDGTCSGLVGRKRREASSVARDDEDLLLAPSSWEGEEEAEGRDASLYEVTGQCDASREWSVFTIEPATAWGQGTDGLYNNCCRVIRGGAVNRSTAFKCSFWAYNSSSAVQLAECASAPGVLIVLLEL